VNAAQNEAHPMSQGTKSLIVNCPHCRAVTKVVNLPADKAAIHCPKCNAEVSLHGAKPLRQRGAAGAGSGQVPLPATPTLGAPQQYEFHGDKGRRRSRLYLAGATGMVLVALVLYLFWPTETVKGSPHEVLLHQLIDLYEQAAQEFDRVQDPRSAQAARSKVGDVAGRAYDLDRKRIALPPAEARHRERVRKLEEDVAVAKQRFKEADERVTRLAGGHVEDPAAAPAVPPPNPAGGNRSEEGIASTKDGAAPKGREPTPPAASRDEKTSTAVPSSFESWWTGPAVPATATPAAPSKKVTVTVLKVVREQATKEYLDRLAALADGSDGFAAASWSGDLLTVEITPVTDLDALAAKLAGFGQVTHLDKARRTITVLADTDKPPAVGSGNAVTPPAPVDRVKAMLGDLQGQDVERRRAAAQRLLRTKPTSDRKADVVKALEARLGDEDAPTRLAAVRAFAAWAGAEAVPTLVKLLDEDNPPLRRTVFAELGTLQDPGAAEVVAKNWLTRDRENASQALQAMGAVAEPYLQPLLAHEDSVVRVDACRLLGKVGTRASIPMLLKLTGDETPPQLAEAAWDAIATIAVRKPKD
jgi:hypothetical protein